VLILINILIIKTIFVITDSLIKIIFQRLFIQLVLISSYMKNFQVTIIGGGVIGSAIARELSKYKLNVIAIEMGSDVATGASKANSGVIHSGINSPPASLKARFCVEGNRMFQSLSNELNVPLKWIGKHVIAKNEDEIKELKKLKKIGIKNKVPGLEIIDGKDLKRKEANINCSAALWVPTAGITLPYQLTIALAENSIENGVNFLLEAKVTNIKKHKDYFFIETNKGNFQSEIVINTTGVNCREIVSMLEEPDFNVYPCRGEYLVLDKNFNYLIKSMIYPIPKKELGVLGIHITPTIDGNILLGPSADYIEDLNDKKTTKEKMKTIFLKAKEIIPSLPDTSVINAYAGIRCKISSLEEGGWADFRIGESKNTSGLINLVGIESPGLTASPAIAKEIVNIVAKYFELKQKQNFKSKRKKRKKFSEMSILNQSAMIKKDEKWGRIVCRCENVTEAEVIEALTNPLGAKTLSSIKYRCRAGMGRCQGGFCTQHLVRIMEDQFKMKIKNMKLKSLDSKLFWDRTRREPND
jgi:glycerol-3-phosphate dehydrogenase